MDIQTFKTYHLVKSEDLNHHGTLYAGRSAEWFVEAGFIAASSLSRPAETVCLQIHGMMFKSPVHLGEIIAYESRVVYTGRTKIVTYIRVCRSDQVLLDGFITFIHVDADGHSTPHGVEIVAKTPEEVDLQQRAMGLFEKKRE